jgi:ABC-2 type transport system permease protein
MSGRATRSRSRPQLTAAARLAFLYFRVGAMNELQYRANFFLQLAQSVLEIGMGLVALALVFSRTEELEGWSRPELLVVMGVFFAMGGVIRTFIQPNMHRLMSDVRLGTLDYVLTKPEDAQVLVSVREVRVWQLTDVVIGAAIVAWGIVDLQGSVGVGDAFAFVGLLALGAVMVYCFWLILTTGAFWFVRMDEIQELFDGVYRAGQYPVEIYPGWLRMGVTFLVPLAFAVTVPAQSVTSRLTIGNVLLAFAVAAGLLVLSRWVWRRGLRRYSGASA